MSLPTVDIVIPCRNEKAYIKACVDSILKSQFPQDQLNIYVVDGESKDGTTAIIQELETAHSQVHLIPNPARVTPIALNLGIKAGKGDVVIILGAHAAVEPDFIQKNVDALQSHPDAGCVGGVIDNQFENADAEVIGAAMSSPFGVGNARFRTGGKAGYVDTVAFGAYRRAVLDQIGLFDEDLVRNQDDELNYRLLKHGYKIWFDPEIRSKYYVRASFRKLFKQYRQYGYWKVYVNVKHKQVTTLRQLVPFAFVLYLFGGGVLAMIMKDLAVFWLIGIIFYLLLGLLMAFRVASSRTAFSVLYAFIILHLSYGIGYTEGVWEFALLGRQPKRKAHELTR